MRTTKQISEVVEKTIKDNYTIIKIGTDKHYDTNDERFYEGNWERTTDSKKHLKQLIEMNPEKFENCKIVKN